MPTFLDLLRVPFGITPHESSLSATWARVGDVGRWFSRSAWSIAVVARLRQRVTGKAEVTFWVPDFFCNESLSLLRQMGVRFVFYPIDQRAHPDAGQFPVVHEDNKPDLFVVVHYFGEPVPCDEALAVCKEHGAWLVEDAAHVLFPVPGVGEVGDCVLYSPHKQFALPDGAILVIRKDGPSFLARHDNYLRFLDDISCDLCGGGRPFDKQTALWLAKRLLQKFGVRLQQKLPSFALDLMTKSEVTAPPGMSAVSKRLLKYELPRIPAFAAYRLRCANEWAEMICSLYPSSGCTVIPFSQPPYLACIAALDQATAVSLYARLHSVGVPVSTWPDLPLEVAGVDHAVAYRFRHTRIYLPVHQAVAINHIGSYQKKMFDLGQSGWSVRQIQLKAEWESLWVRCKRKSLPQTWEYGSAKVSAEGWQAQRYVVHDENNVPIALFQVLVKGFLGIGFVARVNRGPLMLADEPDGESRLALFAISALVREAKRRRWWMMQIAPLLPPGASVEKALGAMGFRRQLICPEDSALLSLYGESDEKMMMGLNGKWRNCLRKGQKLGVSVLLDNVDVPRFSWLLDFYKTQQREKLFDGTSDRMLQALVNNQSRLFKFNIFLAMYGSECNQDSLLGVLVTLQFGDVSEYLIGATNENGRMKQANSVLLWEAVLHAKRDGCRWFDVGGLSENTTKGIADFKRGLNPEPYALVGEWRRWF